MATPAKIITHDLPTIALVGRVNVGKSTLFNRITETNKALVSKIPGTTRTRNIAVAAWRGKNFNLVDTGGLTFSNKIPLEDEIIKQTEMAMAEADLILFVIDIQAGILPQERELAKRLIKNKNKVVFVANKADGAKWRDTIYDKDILSLGFGEPFPVSATNGANLGNLLEIIYKRLGKISKRPKKLKKINPIKVAVIGKPNVGKSSIFNKLIGKDQVIVSGLAHTTREPHDMLVMVDKQPILFIDTAGIRRKSHVSGELEKEGVAKSIQAIKKADIVLLLLDAGEPVTNQDQQLAGLLRESTKSVILIINKWDLADSNEDHFRNEVKDKIRSEFPHLDFAPIIFTSAKTEYRVHQIFPLIARAWEERHKIIPEADLRGFFKKITKEHRPARGKGTRHPEILSFHQIHNNPPMFEMRIKSKTSVHFSYVHYIENRLREQFGFFGAPIIIKLTKIRRDINA
ncbi:MAG: ribosome biogenesis GTPase Der [Patescibacteria group bacterium]